MNISKDLPLKGEKILIIGNRSYRNLGDELILLGTTKLVLAQNKNIIISCFDPLRLKEFFTQFLTSDQLNTITFIRELPKGIRSAFFWFKKGGFRELKFFGQTDTLILGGGEIITEENPSAYRYRLLGIWPFLLKKCFKNTAQLIIMGGIQIPKSEAKRKLFRFLLNKSSHNYLRDFQAVQEIKEFGYPNTSFFMDTSYFSYDRDTVISKSTTEKYIIVNLNKNGEHFFDDIVKDIKSYIQLGYKVFYVPVAKGHNAYYSDLQYKKEIENRLNQKIQLLDRESDFSTFIQKLKGVEKVISTRLHLFLISEFLGVSTKVYPYQKKILKMQEVINAKFHQ